MNSMTKFPRMETIRKTAELFGLPVHFVRSKVSSGEIVAVRAGKRFLVNVDKFAEYLNTSTAGRGGAAADIPGSSEPAER